MKARSLRNCAKACAAAVGMGSFAALGMTTASVHAAAPHWDYPQVGSAGVGQTMTTTTPPTAPVQASVAPTLKATKPKGF